MTDVKACTFLAEKLAARHPNDLSPTERAELNAHVASCPACAAKQADYNLLTTHIRQLPTVAPVAATTREFFWRDSSPLQNARARRTRTFSLFPVRTLGISAGTLVAATILIVSLVLLQQTHSGPASQIRIASQNATATISIAANSCPIPATSGGSISCAASYTGTITNGETSISSPLHLTVRQQQDKLTGSSTLSLPALPTLPASFTANFSGTIDNQGIVHFSIQPNATITITFTGSIHPSQHTISGKYTTNTGQSGTWSVSRG